MKRFLLIAGDSYYPSSCDGDWVGMFETRQEAEELIQRETVHEYFSRGPRKGQIKSSSEKTTIRGIEVDWYDIIDLVYWDSAIKLGRWS